MNFPVISGNFEFQPHSVLHITPKSTCMYIIESEIHTHTATDTQAQSDMHIHAMNEIQYRTCIEATNSGK